MTDYKQALAILDQRFGRDRMISLATSVGDLPSVREVNGYYQDGSFYIITHALSGKMQQIALNPRVALSGEWFSGHGVAENLGHVLKEENRELISTLRQVFSSWYHNGHVDETDPNTCILRVRLTDGVLWKDGIRYEMDFT
ncbi:MAG: pyridoxamine 5'-phosphate oxidase family protein [Clostridiales bacterium]|nr:pyridoxamine 5'-phosphate oxidase family protein [Clostridiales bacterium]